MATIKQTITVETLVNAPIDVVWKLWTTPEDIIHWNNASDDWHTPSAKIDLRTGGIFLYRMEAKDGKFGFDFGGVFTSIKPKELIAYSISDGRTVQIHFTANGTATNVTETFEAENQNSIEQQRNGWQAILNNFKKYAERKTWHK